jgi:hypothetical protein
LAALWLTFPPALAAQDKAVLVERQGRASVWVRTAEKDYRNLRLSSELLVIIKVEGVAPIEVELLDRIESTAAWQIEKPPRTAPQKDGKGLLPWQLEFLVLPLQPGKHELPLPGLQYQDATDRLRQTLGEAVLLRVFPPLAAAMNGGPWEARWKLPTITVTTAITNPRPSQALPPTDIEHLPPVPTSPPWLLWLGIGLGVLLLAAALALIATRRRPPRLVRLSASELAIKRLRRLARVQVKHERDSRRYHDFLATVLRGYLERRFELPARRQTTPEFLTRFTQAGLLPAPQQALLSEILQRCDLARFARLTASPEECQAVVDQAIRFVNESAAPQTPSPPTEAPPSTNAT